MLWVGPIYLAISATAPFNDHCLQVVFLDKPDLMVPLLKRYLGLSRSGITTEGIDAVGAHPQPSFEHGEEPADICSILWGELWAAAWVHHTSIPLPSRVHFPVINSGFTANPGPADFPGVTQVGVPPLPLSHFSLESL